MAKFKFDSERGTQIMSIVTEIHPESANDEKTQLNTEDLAILPLRHMVLFPSITLPVPVGRSKSLSLIKEAMRTHSKIGVVCQIKPETEDPGPKDLYQYGVVADIIKIFELPENNTTVILQGHSCFRIDKFNSTEPYLKAKVSLVEEVMPKKRDREFQVLVSAIQDEAMGMVKHMEGGGQEFSLAFKNIDSPIYLINFLAANLPFDAAVKQDMLEERLLIERGFKLYTALNREAQLLELRESIQMRAQEDLSQQQREHFLHQQIKTIQDELGEGSDDITLLQDRASVKNWGLQVKETFDKELKKLERLNPQSPDYSVQYSYLDCLLNLPWNTYTTDNFNLERVEKKLNKDHFGLEKVKDRILEHLAVLKLRGDMKSPILCLYGPPGVGKTSLGRSIAEALNRKYVRISLGGLHDEAEIRGHRRTYIGAMPGRIIDGLIKSGSSNPVFVLDEIDKIGQDFKGDPASALLEVLDPEQNSKFHDNYVDIDYDLSNILFIATANSLNGISQPLLDRMELIEITGYIQEEKEEIAKKFLVPKQLEECGFEKKEVTFPKNTIAKIIENYTRESGVRSLDKTIAKVLRKIARKKASGEEFPKSIDAASLHEYLGAEHPRDAYQGNSFAGVATGLAWTAVGGEILYIESSLSKGKGEKLTLTGNLGDVMKESAAIALQYLKAHCDTFGINNDLFDKYNIHIHVPEGAIPKDGPSAGITMATSLASSFKQCKVRKNLAMTGEITLRGKVLPVGGIKEKILAAKRAGITDIILSKENERDILEINEIYLKGVKFHYVDNVAEVLDFALLSEKADDAIAL